MNSAGVYRLEHDHAPILGALLSGLAPAPGSIAADFGEQGAARFITARIAERTEGTGHTFAISDRGKVVGLCDLRHIGAAGAVLRVWIADPLRRRGYGSLAVRMMLEFAFRNLRLPLVSTTTDGEAADRLLAKHGFERQGDGRAQIDPVRWRNSLDGPVLARLAPALKAILDAELAAGNEIVETGSGWPDPDSVLVRVRRAFLPVPAALPKGVRYAELNDPHWWKAEYGSESPRHLLVY